MSARLAHLALVGALAGCATPPAPFAAPACHTEVLYGAGTALTGVQPDVAFATDADSLRARCTFLYLDRLPEVLEPMASRTRLVIHVPLAHPLRAVATQTAGGRVGTGAPARNVFAALQAGRGARSAAIAELEGSLPAGGTASFAVSGSARSSGTAKHQLALLVTRGISEDSIAITVEMTAERRIDDAVTTHRELVALDDHPTVDGDALVVVVPSPFDVAAGAAIAIRLEIDTAAHPSVEITADRPARAAAIRRGAVAAAGATPLAPAQAQLKQLLAACRNLRRAPSRAALLHLGDANGAELTSDLALVADPSTLLGYTRALFDSANPTSIALAGPELGFFLERTAYRFLAARLDLDALPPELHACLLRHAGAVGEDSGDLADAFTGTTSLPALRARLWEENQFALRSSRPATRIRAYDWLVARRAEPPHYDPLAPAVERRAALRRATARPTRQREAGR